MKQLSVLVFVLLAFQIALAQTFVSGFINANTTWTTSGSPYIIVGNTLLSSGYTLTIAPGVVVKFDPDKALQIDGQLIAIGTAAQRIQFTSNQSVPMPGDWAKLHFSDLSTDAVFDAAGNYVSGTIMKYCDIQYAGSLGFGAIDVQQSSPYFNQCQVSYSAASGFHYNGGIVRIDSSVIENCWEFGALLMAQKFLLNADSIIGNSQGGVQVWSNAGQSKVSDSYFAFNQDPISWQFNGLASTTIARCTFENNTGTVVNLQGHFDTLTCNKFINNVGGAVIYWGSSNNPTSGGLVYDNLFEGNSNTTTNGAIIEIGAGYSFGAGDTLIFANNIFRSNSCPNGSCLVFDVLFSTQNLLEYLRVYENVFTGNFGNHLMRIAGNPYNSATYDFLYMSHNTFDNPGCQYEMYNEITYGSPNLYLENNYWGSTNPADIDAVIYDFFDFANQSVVYYTPFLINPIAIDTVCRPFEPMPTGVAQAGPARATLQIFPNPSTGKFSIAIPGYVGASKGELEVFDSMAQKVHGRSFSHLPVQDIDLHAPSGVYLVRVVTPRNTWVGKVVIE